MDSVDIICPNGHAKPIILLKMTAIADGTDPRDPIHPIYRAICECEICHEQFIATLDYADPSVVKNWPEPPRK